MVIRLDGKDYHLLINLLRLDNNNGFVIPKNDKGGEIMAIRNGNEILSFIYYSMLNTNYGKTLFINYSFTHPQHRGKGYNTLLRKEVISIGRDNGCDVIMSTPFVGSGSRSIMKKLGFVERGETFVLHLSLNH